MPLHWFRFLFSLAAFWGLLSWTPSSGAAEIRLSNLGVSLNDADVTVQAVLLGAIPSSLREGLEGGIPINIRFAVELVQFRRLWLNRTVVAKTVERQLTYDPLTKEYRVVPLKDDRREPYSTKDRRDAQRVISEFRGLKLMPVADLSPKDLYIVRVRAEVSTGSGLSFFSRLFPFLGTGEETPWVESSLLTITRSQ